MIHIFGYLRPYNNELKVKYVNEYRAEYCTLCHGLRSNLGLLSSLLINYECTFLFIFLSSLYPDNDVSRVTFRCPVNPLKKQTTKPSHAILEYCSFINYYLVLLKLDDSIVDGNWVKRNVCRFLYWFMVRSKKYKRLRGKYSEVAIGIEQCCKELYRLEASENIDYDSCSQMMGLLLQSIVQHYLQYHSISSSEMVIKFAKHLGMWIYLIDAYDDYEEDKKHGSFNPLTLLNPADDSICIQSGDLMLGMMTMNLKTIQKQITFYRHFEIIENIVDFGTRHAVYSIKKKREGKADDKCCKH